MSGYVKIHRKITEWEWYGDLNTRVLFLHLIFTANWKDARFKGIDIPRGSLVTSVRNLAEETGLSIRQTRTALEHLQSTNEVTINRHGKFSVVEVKNYDEYQASDKQEVTKVTSKRQTESQSDDNEPTQIEEGKKEKNKEYIYNPPIIPPLDKPDKKVKRKHGEYGHVTLTDDEYKRLCDEFGEIVTKRAVKAVDEYCQMSGKRYKDYNLVLRKWGIERARNGPTEKQPEKPPDQREEMNPFRERFIREHPEISPEDFLSFMPRYGD